MKRHKNKGTMNKLRKLLVIGCISVALIECGQCVRVRPMDEEPETRTITAPIRNSRMNTIQKDPHGLQYKKHKGNSRRERASKHKKPNDSHRNQTNNNQKAKNKPRSGTYFSLRIMRIGISSVSTFIKDACVRMAEDFGELLVSECIKVAISG